MNEKKATLARMAEESNTQQRRKVNGFSQEEFENGPKEEQTEWKKFLVTDEPEDLPTLISIDNITVCTACNHSLVMGKKKSRKSLFLGWLVSQYQGNHSTDVLLCDTEQGKKHV